MYLLLTVQYFTNCERMASTAYNKTASPDDRPKGSRIVGYDVVSLHMMLFYIASCLMTTHTYPSEFPR